MQWLTENTMVVCLSHTLLTTSRDYAPDEATKNNVISTDT